MMLDHPYLGMVRSEAVVVSDDPEEQVEQVISLMRDYAVRDSRSPEIRRDLEHALRAAGADGAVSGSAAASAIFYHVRRRLSFLTDEQIASPLQSLSGIPIVEALVRPVDMAAMCERGECRRVGDCDDFSMYTASLLLAAGIPCSFVTVAADPADPSRFSHVYVAAYPPEGRIALDVSHGASPGWETDSVYRRREWALADSGIWLAGLVLAYWLWKRRERV